MTSKYRHSQKHEELLVFYRKIPKWNIHKYHKIKTSKTFKNTIRQPGGCLETHRGMSNSRIINTYDPPLPSTIITMNKSINKKLHPTAKDPKMIEDLLKYWTDEGDVVIDPTMGTGATGVACDALGLNFIGIEKNRNYFDLACERLGCD